MALIECIECGSKISDKAQACPKCGCPTSEFIDEKIKVKKVVTEYKCPKCGTVIDEDDEECPECGLKFREEEYVFKCSNCGSSVGEYDTKCKKCGYLLEDEDEEETTVFLCSNCNSEISENDTRCRNCGFYFDDVHNTNDENKPLKGSGVGFALTFFIGIIGYILCLCLGDEDCKNTANTVFVIYIILVCVLMGFYIVAAAGSC